MTGNNLLPPGQIGPNLHADLQLESWSGGEREAVSEEESMSLPVAWLDGCLYPPLGPINPWHVLPHPSSFFLLLDTLFTPCQEELGNP